MWLRISYLRGDGCFIKCCIYCLLCCQNHKFTSTVFLPRWTMWTSVTFPTVLPAPRCHAPAPPCNWLCSESAAVPPGRLPPLPPPHPLCHMPPAPPLRAPHPALPHWESLYTSGTPQSSSALSWSAGRMSQECLSWICWMEAWQLRTADCGVMTVCWRLTNRIYGTAPLSRPPRSYRWRHSLS